MRTRARKSTVRAEEIPVAPAAAENEPLAGATLIQSTEILQATPPDGAAPLDGNGSGARPLEAAGEEKPALKPRKPRAPKVKTTSPDGAAESDEARTWPEETVPVEALSSESRSG
jgi:hypothetical protein